MQVLDLCGRWEYMTDPDGSLTAADFCPMGEFSLPGSTCENGIGKKQEYYPAFSPEAVRAPRERYEYVGVLWLRKSVDIPARFADGITTVFFERVNICSELFFDGVRVGRRTLSLSTPHVYDVSRVISPGKHTLTLRIDNRDAVNFGDMASGYSIDTQGLWCGAVGKIELRRSPVFRIERADVYPCEGGARVTVLLGSDIVHPSDRRAVTVTLTVTDDSGAPVCTEKFARTLYNKLQPESFELRFDAPEWDEFTPALLTLYVDASFDTESGTVTDEASVRFGNRRIEARGKTVTLNGRPLSLRGTIDCAQYPITGYPPLDISVWRRNFKTLKSYGLNHVRFHAWCPPECAFSAADEVGIYVLVEMPLWINADIAGLDYGDDAMHDIFYPCEARRISREYGNHPSFIMFSNGNETMGNMALLAEITTMMKALDPRRLYTATSNFDHPALPGDDYLSASEIGGRPVRIQNLHDRVTEDTALDYSDVTESAPLPVVTFEVGQYCSFPDVDVAKKYTGAMLPVNFDAIKKNMLSHGVYERLSEYVSASGRLAARLYKEDIEAALRTPGLFGFELLSLTDYTGQSTATVGMLDVFFESKGFITPEEFSRFCSHKVPLLRARRIFKNTETLSASFELYDFGKSPTEDPVFTLTVRDGERTVYKTETRERDVSLPLGGIASPTMLSVTLAAAGRENSWRIFVFPELKAEDVPAVKIVSDRDALDRIVKAGGSAVVAPELFSGVVRGSFIPVFWSPVHFPTTRPSGVVINRSHPLLSSFPTEDIPDYQWKTLLDGCRCADISRLDARPIVEFVPNFVDCTPRSPLFEVSVGGARLLVCGFDLSRGDIATRWIKKSIGEYMRTI